jgi:uncharacterized membrane protein (DUF4010 family)
LADTPPLKLRNPFDFGLVLGFGALLAVITALSKGAAIWLGSQGVIALAAVSGLVDVDAITISLGRLAPGGLETAAAAVAIRVAVAVNSAVKVALATTAGGVDLAKILAGGLAAALAAGALGLWIALIL